MYCRFHRFLDHQRHLYELQYLNIVDTSNEQYQYCGSEYLRFTLENNPFGLSLLPKYNYGRAHIWQVYLHQ